MDKFIFLCTAVFIFRYKTVNAGVLSNEQKENAVADEKCTSICTSTDCADVSESFIKNMDQSVDPCDNFYQFVCGNYIKQHVIAEDKVSISQFGAAQGRLNKKLMDAVNSKLLPTDLEAFKKLKTHYKNCLDEAEIEKVGAVPLLNLLNRLGGWPVLLGDKWKEENYKWEEVMSSISKEGFNSVFPIILSVGLDSANSQNFSLKIFSPGTIINDAVDDKFIEAYQCYLVEIAILLGANRERANIEMKDLVEFEQKLFMAKLPRDQLTDVSRHENRKRISDLNIEYLDLPWLDMINKILSPSNVTVTETEFVELYDPKFISELGQLLKNTPKRVLANYQVYTLIEGLMNFLPEKFHEQRLTFLQKTIGLKKLPTREKFCLSIVRNPFRIAISSLYVRNYFNQQSKNKVNKLIQSIREETKASLEKLKWMDDYTRQGALKKLEAMKTLAAYPDELFDDKKVESFYGNMEIASGKFFDNAQKIFAHAKNFNFNKFKKPTHEFEWMPDPDVAVVNAFYNFGKNRISIVAGILQEPFFKSQCLDYLNYGGIGYVIGHEITHGFDYSGRKYDYKGNFKDWWNNKTAADFERKVQCMIDQYNNYTIKQINKKINGKLTRNENIADAGGIKLAYHAYEKSIKNEGVTEACLPNLNYTPKQMFWINAATTWCFKHTDQYLKHAIVEDPHSPAEARVNVVFSNNEEFAKDFNCPGGSMMNPTKKCEVW